jgi:hypothetical protein
MVDFLYLIPPIVLNYISITSKIKVMGIREMVQKGGPKNGYENKTMRTVL